MVLPMDEIEELLPRSWLLVPEPVSAEHRSFLEKLMEILERLEDYAENDRAESAEAEPWWRALDVFTPIAESGWWRRRPEVEVRLDPAEGEFLRRVRRDRERCEAVETAAGDGVRLVVMALVALEVCLRMRDLAGVDGCLELLAGVAGR